jgi:hypothetical protein
LGLAQNEVFSTEKPAPKEKTFHQEK